MPHLRQMGTVTVVVIAILTAYRILSPPATPSDAEKQQIAVPQPRTRSTEPTSQPDSPAFRAAGKLIQSDWDALLAWLDEDPQPSESEIRARLLTLRGKWAEMDPILVAETISRLLASHRDAATTMKFQVGLHGFLNGWPTLRVFLLDALVVADAETAATIARTVLNTTQSADEYAVALRSLTRFGGINATDGELLACFSYTLDRPEWHTSASFAESLDLARTIATVPAAAELLRWEGNPALKAMALHEFAADHPAEVMTALEATPVIEPLLHASLIARLDPAMPDQLAAIDRYFRDPQRTAKDSAAFLQSFPLRSATTGNRLYSPAPTPYQIDPIIAGDQAALTLVNRWIADSTLESSRPDLLDLQARLTAWVEQAK